MANKDVAKTVALPEGTIEGVMTMTGRIGEPNNKGLIRKQNAFDLDFGMMALSGAVYGKVEGQKYKVILIPL